MTSILYKGTQVSYDASGFPVPSGSQPNPSVSDLAQGDISMGFITSYAKADTNTDGTINYNRDINGQVVGSKALSKDGSDEYQLLPLTAAQTTSALAKGAGYTLAITDFTANSFPVYTLTAVASGATILLATAIPANAGAVLAWFKYVGTSPA